MVMGKKESNRYLKSVPTKLEERSPLFPEACLMLVGGEDIDPRLLEVIEGTGAVVVMDETCTGSRYFWEEVPADDDPLTRLAERLLRRPLCPNKDILRRRRFEHVLGLARDYQVDGVLLIHQKFCDISRTGHRLALGEHPYPGRGLSRDHTLRVRK